MDWKYILFDLDGTLTDPKEGITRSVAHALEYFGYSYESLDSLCSFIGPPLEDSFMDYCGVDLPQAMTIIAKYRERFAPVGIFENDMYDGIPRLLQRLKDAGKTLIVATSKPLPFTLEILKHFDIFKYFDYVSGSEFDGTRSHKDEVIAYALEQMNISEPEKCIMIGDREYDVLGARQNGIKTIGVLYGYGSEDEFAKVKADYVVKDIPELEKLLDC